MNLHVTTHATERYLERVNPRATWAEAEQALSSPFIQAAANWGVPFVKLGTGQRVVIQDHKIITVLPTGHLPGRLDSARHRGA